MPRKTNTHSHLPSPEQRETLDDDWVAAGRLVEELRLEPDFIDKLMRHARTNDPTSPEYAKHLAEYTADFVEARRMDGLQDTATLEKMLIIADAGPMIHAQTELRDNPTRLPETELNRLRTICSEYNGELAEFIKSQPDTSFSGIENTIFGTLRDMFPDNEREVSDDLHNTLRGARAEHTFKSIATELGLKVTESNTSEDLHGIDCFVSILGPDGAILKSFPVDVKASMQKVIDVVGGIDTNDAKAFGIKRRNVVYWPGIIDDDFEDSFQLKDSSKKRVLDFNAMQLFMASQAVK